MTSTSKKTSTNKKKAVISPIVKEIVVKAAVEKVWAALTDPEAIGARMGDEGARVVPRVGGRYALFGGVTTGKFTVIEKPSVLEYTWRQREWEKNEPDKLVRWELKPEGKKTRLRLIHSQSVERKRRASRTRAMTSISDPIEE
jgi:uncharacterized protein YndB with AHSA1/START domain